MSAPMFRRHIGDGAADKAARAPLAPMKGRAAVGVYRAQGVIGGSMVAGFVPIHHRVDEQGHAPVDHVSLAVTAGHDVGRLEVAVQHAPVVGILHRHADRAEVVDQLAELLVRLAGIAVGAGFGGVKFVDDLAEVRGLDHFHHVKRHAGGGFAEPVHGKHAGMVELAVDFGFEQEAHGREALGQILLLKSLDCHLSLEFAVFGAKDVAKGTRTEKVSWFGEHEFRFETDSGFARDGRPSGGRPGIRFSHAGAIVRESRVRVLSSCHADRAGSRIGSCRIGIDRQCRTLGFRIERGRIRANGSIGDLGPTVRIGRPKG